MPYKGQRLGIRGPKSAKEKCVIFGCQSRVYALWLCKLHYNQARVHNCVIPHIKFRCFVPNCQEAYFVHSGIMDYRLCPKHREKANRLVSQKGTPVKLEELKTEAIGAKPGPANPNWAGGVFPYKNFRRYMAIRQEILKRDDRRCIDCGEHSSKVMHLNFNKNDHRTKNLAVVCGSCRGKRLGPKGPYCTKYKKRYGLSRQESAEKEGVSVASIYTWMLSGWEPGFPSPTRKLHERAKKIAEYSKKYGVTASAIRYWLRNGWKPGDARPKGPGRPRKAQDVAARGSEAPVAVQANSAPKNA